jgi:hypothetical protein
MPPPAPPLPPTPTTPPPHPSPRLPPLPPWYDSSADLANPKPTNMLDFGEAADRYYTQATRDFVAVYAR